MIVRIWHGWTTHQNADNYEQIVRKEVFDKIEIPGYQGFQLLRKAHEVETEFITMLWFEKLENVSEFAGEDYESAHIPEACEAVLARYEETVQHFEVASSGGLST